jgi:multicomponent K+:H+ antiporter subunit A
MSVVATVGGVLVYFALQRRVNLHRLSIVPGWVASGGKEAFEFLLSAGLRWARSLTGRLQNGSLQRYLLLLVLLALAAGVGPFLRSGPSAQAAALHWNDLSGGVAGVGLLGIAATLLTTFAHLQRLLALVLMGAVGLVVCLTFVYFSAPDLALTQLLVEVATIMLMMLALHGLPASSPPEPQRWRAGRDALIAVAVGLGVAALVWMVLTRPGQSISDYFLATTLPLGGGANAVNVIIVDYRGFDTLGEITVLGIAALILHALVGNLRPSPAPVAAGEGHPLMLQLVSRLVLPFTVLLAIYFYLRGHNLPGGGFIAGLVLAIGLLLQAVAHGQGWVAQRSPLDHRAWVGCGLLMAVLTGMGSWLFGAPFLTSTYDYPWLPGVGGVPLASAALFDAGVFFVVVGATLVMLLCIARIARLTHRAHLNPKALA